MSRQNDKLLSTQMTFPKNPESNIEQNSRAKPWVKRTLVLVLIFAFALIAMNIRQLDEWFLSVDLARQWILLHGVVNSALVFFGINTLLCAFGFPRLWSCAFAGVVFGEYLGLAVSLPSSILGTWMTFEFGRKIGANDVLSKIAARWKNTTLPAFAPDILQTTLLRQLPVPGAILTLLLSATQISRRVFLAGSALGFIPGAVIACFLGHTATTKQTLTSLATTSFAILLAILSVAYLQRARRLGQPARRG